MIDPPEHLNEAAKEEWRRICQRLTLIGRADQALLEDYCIAYAKLIEEERACGLR